MVKSVSIVMPCLNEEQTLHTCIQKAKLFVADLPFPAEIIIADNGSTDNSVTICLEEEVRCVPVSEKGYGAALHAGITAANGTHIIFADADDSYNFLESGIFIKEFELDYDFVIGNRFKGGIAKNAMPFLHRYLGTPVISFLGRRAFKVNLGDFNCGMRGVKKDAYMALHMQSKGMEYATELIAKAAYKGFRITEVPVKLYKDGRDRRSHLRTWSDGWKHLKTILLLSPRWLLLYPAIFFLLSGSVLGAATLFTGFRIFNVVLDIHTLYFCSVFLILAMLLFQFYYLILYHGMNTGIYISRPSMTRIINSVTLERGIVCGSILFITGILVSMAALLKWYKNDFKELDPTEIFRIIIPGGFSIIVGMQCIVFAIFITIMRNNR
jgi:glycosyltransferase involved in cell wall biosynthesis